MQEAISNPFSEHSLELYKDIQYKAKSGHDTIYYYDQLANNYEKEEIAAGYNLHENLVQFLLKLIEKGEIAATKSMSIIDVAAGTGLVGEVLRKRGFTGIIDATDGSPKMLEMAKEKNVYNNFYCHLLEKDTEIPKEMSGGKYDVALVCCAMIRPNIIHQECLRSFVDFVRPGGLILFSLRNPPTSVELDYKMEIEKVAFRLQQEKIWKLVDVNYLKSYRKNIVELEEDITLGQYMFCYKKL